MGDRIQRSEFHRNSHALLRRPGIGHNLGPPLDGLGSLLLWRQAAEKAWRPPSREVALLRLRRAEQLGLSYRDYVGVMLDRGRSLSVLATTLPALGPLTPKTPTGARFANRPRWTPDAGVAAKIGRLLNCEIVVLADRIRHRRFLQATDSAAVNEALGGKVSRLVEIDAVRDAKGAVGAFAGALREMGRAPGETFMVGADWDDVGLAEAAGLPLFKWSWEYFAA
ncbi:MAG: hypothetical protein AB7R90_05180 [Reyranellaceae bacterium]